MKIYTRGGDAGQTGLLSGARVWKDSSRIESFGTVDELNALLGMVRTEDLSDDDDQLLHQIQRQLFSIGAVLAQPRGSAGGARAVSPDAVRVLESAIDEREGRLPALKSFILPGGTPAAAKLHVARCVCRRAERRVVQLGREESPEPETIQYLNRLGDLLFVMARTANQRGSVGDVPWHPDPQ